MKVKLKELATIQTGYTFRSGIEYLNSGSTAVIQMKDLTEENHVDCNTLIHIDMKEFSERHLVKPNDIIFRSRGQVNTSAILADDPGKAVVSAPLFIIRITNARILPDYLNWFISQASAQAFLASHVKGTAQKMIGKQTLEELEIFVPSLECQKKIVEVSLLEKEEQHLLGKLALKRKQYISSVLFKCTQGE